MGEKYSGKQIIRAGEQLIDPNTFKDDAVFQEAFARLSYWRFAHEKPLENALNILRSVALSKDKTAIFAKRLKRYVSIVDKLQRFPDMKLKNMQDIGGCRAIVSNSKKVYQISRELKRKKEFRNGEGKLRYKDYIKYPKEDGYRGYHLIGKFSDGHGETRSIELQIRTRLQHDWATTLEIVDLFTGQALKSNKGEYDWKEFFRSVSEQFALMEEIHMFDTLDSESKQNAYQKKLNNSYRKHDSFKIAQKKAIRLDVGRTLHAFTNSLKITDARLSKEQVRGYVLLQIDTINATVESTLFEEDESEDAEKSYAAKEKDATGKEGLVVALVSTTAVGGIKEAYPNYFADSADFLTHLIIIERSHLLQL